MAAREAELREVSAALAAAREQRNQAAREAEACRVSAAEAQEDVQRSSEMVAASDARAAAAQRQLTQESVGRQRAEAQLADAAVAQREARARRQRRMLGILLSVASSQRALCFARWVAAVAGMDGAQAKRHLDEAASSIRIAVARNKDALNAIDRRDAATKRTASLGNAWLAVIGTWITRVGAAAARNG